MVLGERNITLYGKGFIEDTLAVVHSASLRLRFIRSIQYRLKTISKAIKWRITGRRESH